MVEGPVLDSIDTFTLEEFSLHLEEAFVQVTPIAYLIYQP